MFEPEQKVVGLNIDAKLKKKITFWPNLLVLQAALIGGL